MSLNIEKTFYMIFRSRNTKLDASDEIFFTGCEIEQIQTTKFLGISIDRNLTRKYHVNYVCTTISKNAGILVKSRKVFNMDTLLTLYYSFNRRAHSEPLLANFVHFLLVMCMCEILVLYV